MKDQLISFKPGARLYERLEKQAVKAGMTLPKYVRGLVESAVQVGLEGGAEVPETVRFDSTVVVDPAVASAMAQAQEQYGNPQRLQLQNEIDASLLKGVGAVAGAGGIAGRRSWESELQKIESEPDPAKRAAILKSLLAGRTVPAEIMRLPRAERVKALDEMFPLE